MSQYDDIINLPHHVSSKHPQMSLRSRAAQFSPFAALTGHSEAVEETARLTEEERIIDDTVIDDLNRKLQELRSLLPEHPIIRVTFFEKDLRKSGGRYRTVESAIVKIDKTRQELVFDDGMVIPMRHITHIE